MATSGTYNYSVTRNEIIRDALALLEVYGVGLPIQNEDLQICISFLNKMIKAWQMQGIHLWKKQEAYLFLTPYVSQYDIGGTQTTKCCDTDDAVITSTTAAASAAATTIVVASVTGMSATDKIGVVLTDGTIQWTTISSINTGTKTITLGAALTGTVATSSNVYTFDTYISKPINICSIRRITGIDSTTSSTLQTIEIEHMSYKDYQELPTKTQNNTVPVGVSYLPYNLFGRVFVWPRPSTAATYLQFTYEQMIEDWTTAGENPDFPIEWSEALTYGLATRVAMVFGKADKLNALVPLAQTMLKQILDADQENGEIVISFDDRSYS